MKRLLALVLALLMGAMFAIPAGADDALDGGVTNATGLPIVNEPITLKVAHWFSTGQAEFSDLVVLKELQADTGITFEYVVFTEQEKIKLMYAARDYPDISWRLDGSDVSKLDAIEAGDVVCLDDYMQYAPNITALYERFPSVKLQTINADGHIYSFPFFENNATAFDLRDGVWINRTWLDELNLEIPTTLDELLTVLRAFRDNAGTGTIPEDVIPYYMYYPSAIGGIFDFVCMFGVYVFDASWEAVIDKEYAYQAINPEIIEPIKYLSQMYEEGLLPVSMFTDGWTEYYNNFLSEPPASGIVAGYNNNDNRNYSLGYYYYPMAPVDTGNGKKPYTRTQSFGASWPTNFMIYNVNEYPVASVRLADYMCDTEMSIKLRYGAKGYAWDYNEEGVPYIKSVEINLLEPEYSGVNNGGFTIVDCDAIIDPAYEVEGSRPWAIRNVYADYTARYTYPKLPAVALDDMEQDRMSDISAELTECVNNHIARWIIGDGDIEAEWDAYLAEMEGYGVQEYIELQQKKLDMAYALGEN